MCKPKRKKPKKPQKSPLKKQESQAKTTRSSLDNVPRSTLEDMPQTSVRTIRLPATLDPAQLDNSCHFKWIENKDKVEKVLTAIKSELTDQKLKPEKSNRPTATREPSRKLNKVKSAVSKADKEISQKLETSNMSRLSDISSEAPSVISKLDSDLGHASSWMTKSDSKKEASEISSNLTANHPRSVISKNSYLPSEICPSVLSNKPDFMADNYVTDIGTLVAKIPQTHPDTSQPSNGQQNCQPKPVTAIAGHLPIPGGSGGANSAQPTGSSLTTQENKNGQPKQVKPTTATNGPTTKQKGSNANKKDNDSERDKPKD